ncbi:MAG: HEPN domain-containing protein [Acidimicrobiales bacterium]
MTPGQGERARQDLALAHQALGGTRLLLDAGALEDAASRAYYAAFHASRAALTVVGRHAKTHSGQITLFVEVYGTAPVLGRLQTMRAAADYGSERLRRTGQDLAAAIADADAFVARCQSIVDQALAAGCLNSRYPFDSSSRWVLTGTGQSTSMAGPSA